ncbi:hypothetical protein U1737_09145 [Sphingomonas sp. LB3N6]
MSGGKNGARLEDGLIVGEVSIQRDADGKELATFIAKTGGPNSY